MDDYNPFVPGANPAQSARKIRRLVTGLNDDGRSTVLIDSTCPGKAGHGVPTYVITDLWRTDTIPVSNAASLVDPVAVDESHSVGPSPHGTVFRILELPPDKDWRFDENGAEVKPLPFHSTKSIDYAVVLSGKIWAVLDDIEVEMAAGDVLVQRGTNHAWSNRSSEPCILAFVLVGAAAP